MTQSLSMQTSFYANYLNEVWCKNSSPLKWLLHWIKTTANVYSKDFHVLLTHSLSLILYLSLSHTHAHTHTRTYKHIQTHIYMYAPTHIYICTHSHTHIHTYHVYYQNINSSYIIYILTKYSVTPMPISSITNKQINNGIHEKRTAK